MNVKISFVKNKSVIIIIFQSQDKRRSSDKGRNRSDWHLHIMITLPKWWSTWTAGAVAATQRPKIAVPLTHSSREMRSLLLPARPAAALDQSAAIFCSPESKRQCVLSILITRRHYLVARGRRAQEMRPGFKIRPNFNKQFI